MISPVFCSPVIAEHNKLTVFFVLQFGNIVQDGFVSVNRSGNSADKADPDPFHFNDTVFLIHKILYTFGRKCILGGLQSNASVIVGVVVCQRAKLDA